MKHRGVDFDVEESPPSWWHWKIYPKIEAGPKVICTMKFQTRAAAIDACIVEINNGLDNANAAAAPSNVSGVSFVSWDQRFFDPIELLGRKPLVTLRDAAQFILKLPVAERELPQWETAIECLMLVGDHGGETSGLSGLASTLGPFS